MTSPYVAIAKRIDNAQVDFVRTLKDSFDLTNADAVKVFRVFKTHKIIKLDPVGGRWNLKHGAFWEPDVIQRALQLNGLEN